MKRKLLTSVAILMLSISIIFGCSKSVSSNSPSLSDKDNIASDNSNDNIVDSENNTATPEDDKSDTDSNDNNTDDSSILDKKVQDKFEEAINTIYNFDYSNDSDKISIEDYIEANFTPEGKKSAINKIISYNQKISTSDLLVTLIKEVNNTDDRYSKMYSIRYNITVTLDKPSIYQDLNAIIFVDKDGNIKIESLNENNF